MVRYIMYMDPAIIPIILIVLFFIIKERIIGINHPGMWAIEETIPYPKIDSDPVVSLLKKFQIRGNIVSIMGT